MSGFGIRCTVDGRKVVIGNSVWVEQNGAEVTLTAQLAMAGMELHGETALAVAVDGQLAAVLALADAPKPEAKLMGMWSVVVVVDIVAALPVFFFLFS